ncbi:DNA repair protein RadA [Spiribacter salinus]|uniref:DNA repair protein RadA n=1 Tax=Spiribacter salinus TaxID=1335746 RepID=UPI001C93AA07|nr:DNA repair protein RadA [Spiribacter salinus]MBY5267885.1 DNA repair protein RadA [Spiribacter salinus]
MAKSRVKTLFVCTACGASSPQWAGQCAECGEWNTLEEQVQAPTATTSRGSARGGSQYAGDSGVVSLSEVPRDAETRFPTGIGEFDRVLGGGLVAGGVVLLGGDPGIGKSTLLLEAVARVAGRHGALYVTGEESLRQVGMRAERLGVEDDGLKLLAETRVEAIIEMAARERPEVLVVDSIQTIHSDALGSAPGGVAQVRESAAQLVQFAKRSGTVLFLVGHVTKEGQLAGPRVLEHMVDTVLYFESDSGSRYRLLRAVKNRFGAANELGVFAMLDTGLKEVKNPSAIFLSRHEQPVPGSAILVTREGTRPLLLELQALVAESPLSNPRRLAVGLDGNRLGMLLAVLQRHAGVSTYGEDVFVNVVGGVRVAETASDLPALLAVVSSLRDRPIPQDWVIFGEVGLAGEIRPVPNGADRLAEAARHGFRRALVPMKNCPAAGQSPKGLEVLGVERLDAALEIIREADV